MQRVRPVDAELLAEQLRAEDSAEVLAAGWPSPEVAIRTSLDISLAAFSIWAGRELLGLGGVHEGPRLTLLSVPSPHVVWFLSGVAVNRHRAAFWRASQRVIAVLLDRWSPLVNRIDSRYEASIRWARRMGGEIGEPSAQCLERVPFVPVTWRRA